MPAHGGLAQYFVERRGVGWAAFGAVLLWGWFSYGVLPQQEDPIIPQRQAVLVTLFPGAGTAKMDELVTKKLEDKIAELQAIEETQSDTRPGQSIIKITLRPGSETFINQQWSQLRAKVQQVQLPEGCNPPDLDTDFGDTITMLYAITSPPFSEAECQVRADLVRSRLAELRRKTGANGRAAVVGFFPVAMAATDRSVVIEKFLHRLKSGKMGNDVRLSQGESMVLADFATTASRQDLQRFIGEFLRSLAGSAGRYDPDFGEPLLLIGAEDPLPQIRATAMPRYTYRQLRKMADLLNDEIKQVPSAGRITRIGLVQEAVHLYYSLSRHGLPAQLLPGDRRPFGTQRPDPQRHSAHRRAQLPGAALRRVQERPRAAQHDCRPVAGRQSDLPPRRLRDAPRL